MKKSIVNALGKHSNINQQTQIKSPAMTMTMVKTENVNKNQTIYEGLGKSNVPSICKMILNNNPNACSNTSNITMSVIKNNLRERF